MPRFRFGSSRGLNAAVQRQCHDSLWGAWYSGLQQTVTVIPPYLGTCNSDFLSTSMPHTTTSSSADEHLPFHPQKRRILHSRSQEIRQDHQRATGTRPKTHYVHGSRPRSSLSASESFKIKARSCDRSDSPERRHLSGENGSRGTKRLAKVDISELVVPTTSQFIQCVPNSTVVAATVTPTVQVDVTPVCSSSPKPDSPPDKATPPISIPRSISTPVAARPTSQRRRGRLERGTRIHDEPESSPNGRFSHLDSLNLDYEEEEADHWSGEGEAIQPSTFGDVGDDNEVAYIDNGGDDDDLLEWLTLYDAPRQSKDDSDL